MVEVVAHYKRAEYHGSPDYSFEWLWEASNRYLLMNRENHMQESLSRSLNGVSERAAPATYPKGKRCKQGKGKCDKGARDRSSSNGPKSGPRGRSASPGKGTGK